MRFKTVPIVLTDDERRTLTSWINSGTTEKRLAERAGFILAIADGLGTNETARRSQTRSARVSKWRRAFAARGIAGLQDAPRPGQPRRYTEETEKRILEVLDQKPPKGFSQWTGRMVARELGTVHVRQVYRVLSQRGIHLQRRRSWCISTDPEFARKAADIVGLYLAPPENAMVLAVDEKPHIQALERAQGWLRLPNGKAVTGFSHEYKRNGTSSLFAALEVSTGLVKTGHYNRRRRREFLDFMNDVIQGYDSDTEIHVILDNLSTHKPKNDRWLARHPNVHLHYTPTHASWLNMVEVWFSILSRQCLRGSSCASVRQLRTLIDDFTAVYTESAAPFEWRKTVVFQQTPARRLADASAAKTVTCNNVTKY